MPTTPMSGGASQARQRGIEIRPYQAEDEKAVVALLQDAFGRWPTDIEGVDPVRFFRWKHGLSPFGGSLAVVAVDDGALVGFLAWLPWLIRCRGETIRTFRTADFVVAGSHRGGNVSTALIRAGKERLGGGYAFSWSNPNDLSRGRASSSGQRRVGAVRVFARASAGGLRARLGAPVNAPRAGAQDLGRMLDAPPDWLAELLEGHRSERLHTARDLAFLRWRYGLLPGYLAVSLAGEGLAILRLRSKGRVRIAKVCELLVAEGDLRAARQLVQELARTVPGDLLACSFPAPSAAARCGFLPVPGGQALMVRPMQPALAPDPTRAASWYLSLGDLELI